MKNLLKPITNVQLVNINDLKPNNYNPNEVSKRNLDLLEKSIKENGWTLPIVAQGNLTIIDGYHRWLIAKNRLYKQLKGKVPVVIIEHHDEAKNQYATITHNRARGVHQLTPMENIINGLLSKGKTIKDISEQLGMGEEEIFRLSKMDKKKFLERMHKNKNYSKAKIILKY